jgi:hypothetical protein
MLWIGLESLTATVEIISDGHWKLFTPEYRAAQPHYLPPSRSSVRNGEWALLSRSSTEQQVGLWSPTTCSGDTTRRQIRWLRRLSLKHL